MGVVAELHAFLTGTSPAFSLLESVNIKNEFVSVLPSVYFELDIWRIGEAGVNCQHDHLISSGWDIRLNGPLSSASRYDLLGPQKRLVAVQEFLPMSESRSILACGLEAEFLLDVIPRPVRA